MKKLIEHNPDNNQLYTSLCVVRQAGRIPLPQELVDYHTGILVEHNIPIDKVRHLTSERLQEDVFPKLITFPIASWEIEFKETEIEMFGTR